MANETHISVPTSADELARNIEWRLENLYYVKDNKGVEVPFCEMPLQRTFRERLHWRNVVLKSRQIGITTEIFIIILDHCLFNANQTAAIICHSPQDATDLVEQKFVFAYERLPSALRHRLVKDNVREKRFLNGSRIMVGTSFRGGTIQILNITEYAKLCADDPPRAREIKTGTLNTLAPGTLVISDSTARGHGGYFHEMWRDAKLATAAGRTGRLDYRAHFYPWHLDPRCRLYQKVPIPQRLEDYFTALQAKHGIELSCEQRWWYTAKEAEQKKDMRQEYPSVDHEAFEAVIEGAYYEREILDLHRARQVCNVAHDPALLVHTAWDIGVSAIWFFQVYGKEIRLIRYYEDSGNSMQYYARMFREYSANYGYEYGVHLGPHDLNVRNILSEERRLDAARKAGLNFIVVPRVKEKQDAIEAAGNLLHRCWFDQRLCERGLNALTQRRRKWNELLNRYENVEQPGWWEHACDAFEQIARGLRFVSGASVSEDLDNVVSINRSRARRTRRLGVSSRVNYNY